MLITVNIPSYDELQNSGLDALAATEGQWTAVLADVGEDLNRHLGKVNPPNRFQFALGEPLTEEGLLIVQHVLAKANWDVICWGRETPEGWRSGRLLWVGKFSAEERLYGPGGFAS